MKRWLIIAGMFALAIYLAFNLHVFAQKPVDIIGCRQTRHPQVCAESYHKCDNIGLNEACLEVAKLDGYYGYDIMKQGMSQNAKTGDKPVDYGDK